MNRPVREDGYLYCPQCGHELIWDDTFDRGDVDENGVPEPDYTTIDLWHCSNCGVSLEVWQALECEKDQYPYWNGELDK